MSRNASINQYGGAAGRAGGEGNEFSTDIGYLVFFFSFLNINFPAVLARGISNFTRSSRSHCYGQFGTVSAICEQADELPNERIVNE